MRYIYFEVHRKSNHMGWDGPGSIKNVNILLLRPINLNSVGMWGYGHETETRNSSDIIPKSLTEWGRSYIVVNQYWVDIQVYESCRGKFPVVSVFDDEWIDKAIKMAEMSFREIVRESKINSIGI